MISTRENRGLGTETFTNVTLFATSQTDWNGFEQEPLCGLRESRGISYMRLSIFINPLLDADII